MYLHKAAQPDHYQGGYDQALPRAHRRMNAEQVLQALLVSVTVVLILIGWVLHKVYKIVVTLQKYEDDKWDYECARYYGYGPLENYTREETERWQRNGWEAPAALQRRPQHRAQGGGGRGDQWGDW